MATPDIAYCPNHGVHEGHYVEPDPEDPHRWRSITWNCGTVTTPNKPPEPAGRVERARAPKETPAPEMPAQAPAEPQEDITINAVTRWAYELLSAVEAMEWQDMLDLTNFPRDRHKILVPLIERQDQARMKLGAALSRFREEQHQASERQRVAEEKS